MKISLVPLAVFFSLVAVPSSAHAGHSAVPSLPILYLERDPTDSQNRGNEQGINIIAHRTGNLDQPATYLLDIKPTGPLPIAASDIDAAGLKRSITFAAGEDVAATTIFPRIVPGAIGTRTATVEFDPVSTPSESLERAAKRYLPLKIDIQILPAQPQH